jgi:hypothetical protein
LSGGAYGDTEAVPRVGGAVGGTGGGCLAGTNAARGEYTHYVDGDDWLEPDMESALMAALIETGADIAVTGYIDTRGIRHPAGSVPAGTYDRAALEEA